MRPLIRAFAALAAAFSLAVSLAAASYAETTNGIAVSDTAPGRGEEFTVSLIVPPAENADTASVIVQYDDSAFEGIEFSPDVHGSVSNIADGIIALSAANVERSIILTNGLTLTAKLKVRDTAADGTYEFVLKDNSFCYVKDDGWEFEDVWFPEVTKVAVTIGSPAEAGAVTASEETSAPETEPTEIQAPESEPVTEETDAPVTTEETTPAETVHDLLTEMTAAAAVTTSAAAQPADASPSDNPTNPGQTVFIIAVSVLSAAAAAVIIIAVVKLCKKKND